MPAPMDWGLSGPYLIAALIGGYMLGSIPFGLILTRLAGMGDIRAIGSGNIGATNVLRTGNKMLALLTLLLDGGKGALAVLIAQTWGPDVTVCAALGAFFGHNFPLWLRFKGGKGMATLLGVTLALHWQVGVMACATWAVVAALTRISSAATLVAAALTPLYFWLFGLTQLSQLGVLLAGGIFFTHRSNISRLRQGTEPKIGAAE